MCCERLCRDWGFWGRDLEGKEKGMEMEVVVIVIVVVMIVGRSSLVLGWCGIFAVVVVVVVVGVVFWVARNVSLSGNG